MPIPLFQCKVKLKQFQAPRNKSSVDKNPAIMRRGIHYTPKVSLATLLTLLGFSISSHSKKPFILHNSKLRLQGNLVHGSKIEHESKTIPKQRQGGAQKTHRKLNEKSHRLPKKKRWTNCDKSPDATASKDAHVSGQIIIFHQAKVSLK